MSKTLKQVRCGRLVCTVVYTGPSPGDPPKQRAQKQKASTAARERLNARTSYEKLERCLADNFDNGDLLVTLTYAPEHLPDTRKKAVGRLRTWLPKVRAARKARGHPSLRYVYVTEGCCPGGRIHHHLVMDATGDDLEELQQLWRWGKVEITRLAFDRDHTYEDLASYLTKEPREWGHPRVGERMWTPSLGLTRSEPETVQVPDMVTVEAPPEAVTVSKDGPHQNGWGEWCWIKYLLPYDPARRRPPKPKRKRRKKKE